MATFVIGDIHGGFKALQQVLERANIQSSDTLIFMGDLVDGWSEAFQTVDFLIDLSKKQHCIFIKGNHDIWLLNKIVYNDVSDNWLANGGIETWESYKNASKEKLDEHGDFLLAMNDYFVDDQNRLFVHGGFTAITGPEDEDSHFNFTIDRSLFKEAVEAKQSLKPDNRKYPKRLKLFREIFIGHTPTINLGKDKPITALNLTNVDTGAAFYGKLSIMNIDTKEFWQSDTLPDLYPNERGRNY